MRHLELTEGAPPAQTTLSATEAIALEESELATVSRRPGVDSWEVAPGRKVGAARVGDVHVVVRPKVSTDRLIFLMGYTRNPNFWRETPTSLDAASDLVEALAHSFIRRAATALEQGLIHGYVEVAESLTVVRGRIRIEDQISRRPGKMSPLEVTYDDFSVDTAENRVLLAAVLRLLRVKSLEPQERRRLHRLRMQLSDVTPTPRGQHLPKWRPTRLNVRYQPALTLAELILAGDSFEQQVGDLHVSGFVFDMWRIYEDFVGVALTEAMKKFGGRSSLQHQMHLDEARRVSMRPDFYWSNSDGQQAVVDAKYKATRLDAFPNADLYQLLAYCTVLGVDHGHLVYAKGNGETTTHQVAGSAVRIHCHTLDLSAPPEVLLMQVADVALTIRGAVVPLAHSD